LEYFYFCGEIPINTASKLAGYTRLTHDSMLATVNPSITIPPHGQTATALHHGVAFVG
jgi:hypothetical protein